MAASCNIRLFNLTGGRNLTYRICSYVGASDVTILAFVNSGLDLAIADDGVIGSRFLTVSWMTRFSWLE
jgi:hypothetical protein